VGRMQRTKGARAQTAAKALLTERDWTVVSTSSGASQEDLVASREDLGLWSVEVKDCKLLNLPKWRKQARDQAKRSKLPWMLLAHIPGTRSWLVERQGERAVVWHERAAGSEAA